MESRSKHRGSAEGPRLGRFMAMATVILALAALPAPASAALEPVFADDVNPGPSSSYFYDPVELDGKLIFGAGGPTGFNPWSFDGKESRQLADAVVGFDSEGP